MQGLQKVARALLTTLLSDSFAAITIETYASAAKVDMQVSHSLCTPAPGEIRDAIFWCEDSGSSRHLGRWIFPPWLELLRVHACALWTEQ